MVMLKCLERLGVSSFDELEQKIQIKRGFYANGLHSGPKSTIICSKKKEYINTADPSKFDFDNYFYDKEVLFTGKMTYGNRATMRTLVDNIGGHSVDDFRESVDVLVEGLLDPKHLKDGKSEKQRKCERKLARGESIEILSEDEFYERFGLWKQ